MTSLLQRRKVGRDPDFSVYQSPSSTSDVGSSTTLPLHSSTNSDTARWRVYRKKRNSPLLRLCFGSGLFVISFLFAYCVVVPVFLRIPPPPVRLPVANVDIAVPNATEWPLIHIVNTRFMQEQATLTTLAMARLHLFWTFCFPTMIGQSTQQFLWIIKTDPQFCSNDNPVFRQLIETVQPYPNIYIVASNQNYLISPDLQGCWRDGQEGRDLLQSKIYTGDLTRLHQAIALREERPILETRLDADDGLHYLYLEYMQHVALKRFRVTDQQEQQAKDDRDQDGYDATTHRAESTTKWLYWCTRRHLEWRSSPTNESSSKEYSAFGLLNPIEHSKLCITPGITVGYNVGVKASEVPSEAHDLLYKRLVNSTACNQQQHLPSSKSSSLHAIVVDPNKPQCLDLVDGLLFSAVRSRTWTSAGMLNVQPPDYSRHHSIKMANDKLWQLLEERFHLNRTQAQETQDFLHRHKAQIAYENLLGQCTSHHSCKQQAKEELEQYTKQGEIHIVPPPTRTNGGSITRRSSWLRLPSWYPWLNPTLTTKEERP